MTFTWLGSARALLDAGVLLVFGTALYRVMVGPASCRLLATGTAAAWLGGAITLVLTAGMLLDDHRLPVMIGAVPEVVRETLFGHALMVRLAAVTAAALLARARWPSLLAAVVSVASQAELGHPAAMGGLLLPTASILHALGADGWIGSLPALALALRTDPRARWRYYRLGLSCVLALLAGALAQALILVGGLAGLLGTEYGKMILYKGTLLLALLACAAANRFVLARAMSGNNPIAARRRMERVIFVQAVLGLAAIWLAANLAELPPPAH